LRRGLLLPINHLINQTVEDGPNGSGKKRANGKRTRRTGKELVQFRKMLKAERKRGVSVAALARKHGISPAYIYLLP
jgi:hypothetical protein